MWLVLLLAMAVLGVAVFAIVAAFVAVTVAVIGYLFPVLLIVGGAWLLVKAITGSDDRRWARNTARAHRRRDARPAAAAATRQPAQPRQPAGPPRRELPVDVQVKAEQIRHKVNVLLGCADRFPPFSQDLYIVRQTAAEYLPRTIAAYLAIPGTDDPIVRGTGRTALAELRAQLAMLDSRLDAITDNLQQRDLDGLIENRRFLEERFGADEGGPRIVRSA